MKQDKSRMTPIAKKRLHEEIMEQLKDKIIRGDLKPGSKLPPERELANQLEVNRTTVREALHKLESMELIEIKHGNGIFVRDFFESGSLELAGHILFLNGKLNIKILRNLLDLRRLLVPEISYYAALNRSKKDLDELERMVFQSDEILIEEKDWRVHNIIARASGNLLFVILLNSFTGLTKDLSQFYFEIEENRIRSQKFHGEIYKAIKRKDSLKAKEIMLNVLKFAEEQTLKALGIDIRDTSLI
ncbi:MAG: FadR family transcriptional regulator [Deltaproteobacteria bacterium]|nr:FadR family transcriptional regulator [Deltaproteobacteria bacterium]